MTAAGPARTDQQIAQGHLPDGWVVAPLINLIDPARGISYGIVQPGQAVHDGVPILRVNNIRHGRLELLDVMRVTPEIEAKHARTRLRGGEVLLTLVGTVGEVAIAPAELEGWNVARAVAVIPPLGASAIWIAANLRSGTARRFIDTRVTTTVQVTLNLRDVNQLPIVLPPASERAAIAELLSALDDRIELNRRTNETLMALAQARHDGIVSPAESESALENGWRVGRLDDLLILQRGFDLPSQERVPGEYPIVSAGGVSGSHAKPQVRGPGVVIGRSGVLGNVFYVHEDFWPLNTTLWVKEFRAAGPIFAYFTLRTIDTALFNAGSAVPTLNRNHVHGLPFLIPPREVAAALEAQLSPLFAQHRANQLQSETVATLRDTLLPRLLSGELRVRDAEPLVAAAV